MECKKVEDYMSAFLENDLSADLTQEIDLHLKNCPSCMELKEQLEKLSFISGDSEEEVPFYLKNRLSMIPEMSEEPEPRFLYFKWAAAMVASVVLMFNLFYFTNIFPSANRTLHTVVTEIETFAVQTSSLLGQLDKGGNLTIASSGDDIFEDQDELGTENSKDKLKNKGGKNG